MTEIESSTGLGQSEKQIRKDFDLISRMIVGCSYGFSRGNGVQTVGEAVSCFKSMMVSTDDLCTHTGAYSHSHVIITQVRTFFAFFFDSLDWFYSLQRVAGCISSKYHRVVLGAGRLPGFYHGVNNFYFA